MSETDLMADHWERAAGEAEQVHDVENAAAEGRQARAEEEAEAEDRWTIELDGEGTPTLWAPHPGGNAPGRPLVWSRELAERSDPQWATSRPALPLWHALEHLHRHGLLHAVMERRLPPPANAPDESELDRLHRLGVENVALRQDYDRLRRELAELEAGSQRLSIQRQELVAQLDRAEARAADAEQQLAQARADRDHYRRQLREACLPGVPGDHAEASPRPVPTRYRPGPGREGALGVGMARDPRITPPADLRQRLHDEPLRLWERPPEPWWRRLWERLTGR